MRTTKSKEPPGEGCCPQCGRPNLVPGEPWAEVRLVYPTEAKEWLETRNTSNRNQNQTHIDYLATELNEGRYRLGNDFLAFDKNVKLLNGQHRLAMCVQTNRPILIGIVYNLEPESQLGMDRVKARRLAEHLKFVMLMRQSSDLASCCNLGWRWEHRDPLRNRPNPSFEVAANWLVQNPSMPEEMKASNFLYRHLRIPLAVVTAVLHQLVLIDPDVAKEFYGQIRSGEGLQAGDPVKALRNYMTNQMRITGRKPDQDEYMARLIKTWNAWSQDKPLQQLTWRRRGNNREDFPQLLDLDGNPWRVRSEIEDDDD